VVIKWSLFSLDFLKLSAKIGKNWKIIMIPRIHGQASLVVSKSIIL
jgi:hypothetical protein